MARITYLLRDGTRRTVDEPAGTSAMRAAVLHGVPGIIGECGGYMNCATCHVYAHGPLPPMSSEEAETLECVAAARRDNSRLACQIVLADGATEGLLLEMPEAQK